jgi:ribonuclease VapC
MVVDTSALVAIIMDEPGANNLRKKLAEAPQVVLPAPTVLESLIVLQGELGADPTPLFDRFVTDTRAAVVVLTPSHAQSAFEAFLRFGKGRHPAALNFGDCMAYAVAKVTGLPLLYVGEDFSKTGIAAA